MIQNRVHDRLEGGAGVSFCPAGDGSVRVAMFAVHNDKCFGGIVSKAKIPVSPPPPGDVLDADLYFAPATTPNQKPDAVVQIIELDSTTILVVDRGGLGSRLAGTYRLV